MWLWADGGGKLYEKPLVISQMIRDVAKNIDEKIREKGERSANSSRQFMFIIKNIWALLQPRMHHLPNGAQMSNLSLQFFFVFINKKGGLC